MFDRSLTRLFFRNYLPTQFHSSHLSHLSHQFLHFSPLFYFPHSHILFILVSLSHTAVPFRAFTYTSFNVSHLSLSNSYFLSYPLPLSFIFSNFDNLYTTYFFHRLPFSFTLFNLNLSPASLPSRDSHLSVASSSVSRSPYVTQSAASDNTGKTRQSEHIRR